MPEEKPQQSEGQPTNSDPKQQADPREVQKGNYGAENKGTVRYETKDLKSGQEE